MRLEARQYWTSLRTYYVAHFQCENVRNNFGNLKG